MKIMLEWIKKLLRRPGREAVDTLVLQVERDGERMAPPLDPEIARRLRQRLGLS